MFMVPGPYCSVKCTFYATIFGISKFRNWSSCATQLWWWLVCQCINWWSPPAPYQICGNIHTCVLALNTLVPELELHQKLGMGFCPPLWIQSKESTTNCVIKESLVHSLYLFMSLKDRVVTFFLIHYIFLIFKNWQ